MDPTAFVLTPEVALFCSVIALVAGFVDSIAGGGGLLTMPALLLSGVPPHLALGTSKIQATLGTTAALAMFAHGHCVLWRLALWGLGFSLLGSALGSSFALWMDEAVLGGVMLALLPFAMVFSLLPKKERPETGKEPEGMAFWLGMPLICLVLGAYDGFFGPGTGTFLILGLHWILRLDLVRSSATSKVLNLGSNVGALAVFAWHGQYVLLLALPMVVASILGNCFGSRTAMRVGAKAVRRFLTVSLGILFCTLVVRTFF